MPPAQDNTVPTADLMPPPSVQRTVRFAAEVGGGAAVRIPSADAASLRPILARDARGERGGALSRAVGQRWERQPLAATGPTLLRFRAPAAFAEGERPRLDLALSRPAMPVVSYLGAAPVQPEPSPLLSLSPRGEPAAIAPFPASVAAERPVARALERSAPVLRSPVIAAMRKASAQAPAVQAALPEAVPGRGDFSAGDASATFAQRLSEAHRPPTSIISPLFPARQAVALPTLTRLPAPPTISRFAALDESSGGAASDELGPSDPFFARPPAAREAPPAKRLAAPRPERPGPLAGSAPLPPRAPLAAGAPSAPLWRSALALPMPRPAASVVRPAPALVSPATVPARIPFRHITASRQEGAPLLARRLALAGDSPSGTIGESRAAPSVPDATLASRDFPLSPVRTHLPLALASLAARTSAAAPLGVPGQVVWPFSDPTEPLRAGGAPPVQQVPSPQGPKMPVVARLPFSDPLVSPRPAPPPLMQRMGPTLQRLKDAVIPGGTAPSLLPSPTIGTAALPAPVAPSAPPLTSSRPAAARSVEQESSNDLATPPAGLPFPPEVFRGAAHSFDARAAAARPDPPAPLPLARAATPEEGEVVRRAPAPAVPRLLSRSAAVSAPSLADTLAGRRAPLVVPAPINATSLPKPLASVLPVRQQVTPLAAPAPVSSNATPLQAPLARLAVPSPLTGEATEAPGAVPPGGVALRSPRPTPARISRAFAAAPGAEPWEEEGPASPPRRGRFASPALPPLSSAPVLHRLAAAPVYSDRSRGEEVAAPAGVAEWMTPPRSAYFGRALVGAKSSPLSLSPLPLTARQIIAPRPSLLRQAAAWPPLTSPPLVPPPPGGERETPPIEPEGIAGRVAPAGGPTDSLPLLAQLPALADSRRLSSPDRATLPGTRRIARSVAPPMFSPPMPRPLLVATPARGDFPQVADGGAAFPAVAALAAPPARRNTPTNTPINTPPRSLARSPAPAPTATLLPSAALFLAASPVRSGPAAAVRETFVRALPTVHRMAERAPQMRLSAAGPRARGVSAQTLLAQRAAQDEAGEKSAPPPGANREPDRAPGDRGAEQSDVHLLANEVWSLLKRRLRAEAERQGRG